jgi:hypothetical protein
MFDGSASVTGGVDTLVPWSVQQYDALGMLTSTGNITMSGGQTWELHAQVAMYNAALYGSIAIVNASAGTVLKTAMWDNSNTDYPVTLNISCIFNAVDNCVLRVYVFSGGSATMIGRVQDGPGGNIIVMDPLTRYVSYFYGHRLA